jgi:pimeloyl-ACP methyl ester carboxylesterase
VIRALIVVVMALLAALVVRLAVAPMPQALEAAFFVEDLVAGAGSSWLKRTRGPVRRSVWTTPDGVGGDIYRLDGRLDGEGRAALVLVPGASPEGKDHPHLIAFAESLARVGFVVHVPELPRLRRLQVSHADAVDIGAAVGAVAEATRARPVGIAAISYAVGPAVIAALETPGGARAAFILGIGGYYDSRMAITYVTTGHFRAPGEASWRWQEPNAYGKWVFVLSNLDRIENLDDRVALEAIARQGLAAPFAHAAAQGLGAEAQAVLALIANRDPDKAPALIDRLPPAMRAEIDSLSLAGLDLSGLRARLILVHGRDDGIIPSTESEALAEAVGDRSNLFLINGLAHISLSLDAVGDAWRLWAAARALLAQRM